MRYRINIISEEDENFVYLCSNIAPKFLVSREGKSTDTSLNRMVNRRKTLTEKMNTH